MLTDVLGVVIAFVSIILLMSMLVTGLVQATQSLLRLRARNLEQGVKKIIEAYSDIGPHPEPRKEARKTAARILNSRKLAVVDRVADPDSVKRRVLGPKVSWAQPRDLAVAIHSEIQTGDANTLSYSDKSSPGSPAVDEIQDHIQKIEPALSKRFAYFIRLITVAWAVIIAASFQVSAPDLFSALSNDPARVKLIGAQTAEILKDVGAAMAEDEYDLIADDALDQLAAKYPAYKDQIDQAGNAAPTKELLVQQLADVLPNDAKRQDILAAYSSLVDTIAQQKNAQPRSDNADALARLSVFGVQFWKNNGFYKTPEGSINWQSVIGVLFTAILLSFGAPFWFERLRDLAKLRDVRAQG